VIPSELTTPIIAAASVTATWLVAILTRKGAREDNRIREDDQAFEQISSLAATRLTEINRLTAERDAANVERERLRVSWEERWDRQMTRCREITAPLVDALAKLQANVPGADQETAAALRALAEHNDRDHTD
jgi:hypothetical protein